jgi:hypothetical protein
MASVSRFVVVWRGNECVQARPAWAVRDRMATFRLQSQSNVHRTEGGEHEANRRQQVDDPQQHVPDAPDVPQLVGDEGLR